MLSKAAGKTAVLVNRLLREKTGIIIAIDGRCAAGKSTLAELLRENLDCAVIHMDDFFLRPEQRTQERYSQPGGNIDYERFEAEVLIPLKERERFSYRPFNCGTMTFDVPVDFVPKAVTIIEGSYSCHPALQDYYDLCIFLTTPYQVQAERLKTRSPFLFERFMSDWIPMEERYFEEFNIPAVCQLRFET